MAAEPYLAFISYSRTSSQPLAVDLQHGLERFAKPWYRLRAFRVFRDDSSMAASTALWSTIETGLRQAGWFLLLATPAAAASGYVAAEIEWWLRTKGPQRLLIVQAAGELVWDRQRGCFAESSTALPPILHRAYPEEPRWVDLRWYAANPATGRTDPRFTERVADLAAALRGVERDTLIGENVRQHRRALALARGGVATLAVLLVLSIVATIFAVGQRDTARDQARIALSRQLAATARTLIDHDIGRARLLAVQAYRTNPDLPTETALLATLTASPQLVRVFDTGGNAQLSAGSTDGGTVFAATHEGTVMRWDSATGTRTVLGDVGGLPHDLGTSADGSVVAVTTEATLHLWQSGRPVTLPAGPLPTQLVAVAVSPSGRTVVVGSNSGQRLARVYRRTDTGWSLSPVPLRLAAWADQLRLVDDDAVVAWHSDDGIVERLDLTTGRVLARHTGLAGATQTYPGALDPTGAFVALPLGGNLGSMGIYRTDRDHPEGGVADRIGFNLGAPHTTVALSPGARLSAYAADDTVVVAPTQAPGPTPFALTTLHGLLGTAGTDVHFLNDHDLLVTSDSRVLLFDLEQPAPIVTSVAARVATVAQADVPPALVPNAEGDAVVTPHWRAGFTVTLLPGGELLTSDATATFLAWVDHRSLLYADTKDGRVHRFEVDSQHDSGSWPFSWAQSDGQYDIVSARYLAESAQLLVAGTTHLARFDATTFTVSAARDDLGHASFSPDGRYAFGLGGAGGREPVVADLTQGRVTTVATSAPIDDSLVQAGLFSGYDGDLLVLQTGDERNRTFFSPDGRTQLGSGPAAFDPNVRIAVAPDGRRYAAQQADGSLQLITVGGGPDVAGTPVGEFAIPGGGDDVSFGYAGDGSRLLVAVPGTGSADRPGTLLSVDLRPTSWITAACRTAGRDLTVPEWTALTGQPAPATLRCAG